MKRLILVTILMLSLFGAVEEIKALPSCDCLHKSCSRSCFPLLQTQWLALKPHKKVIADPACLDAIDVPGPCAAEYDVTILNPFSCVLLLGYVGDAVSTDCIPFP